MKTSEVPKGSCFWIFTPWYHTVPAVFTSQLVPGLGWFQLGIHRPKWKWYTFFVVRKALETNHHFRMSFACGQSCWSKSEKFWKMRVSYFVSRKNTMCISFLYLYTQKSIHHLACKDTISNMKRSDPLIPSHLVNTTPSMTAHFWAQRWTHQRGGWRTMLHLCHGGYF